MTEMDPDDFLMGGGTTSAKFEDTGDVVRGKIVAKAMRQQTDFTTKEPKFWKDGSPMMQLVVTLQTDENDPEIEDDNGQRNLYVRYKLQEAVKAAVKKAGASKLDIGGELAVKFVSREKNPKGGQPIKIYRAKYTAPDPADFTGEDDFLADDDDEPTPPPAKKAPAKKAVAKKAPAKKAAAPVEEYTEDDGDDDGF